MKILLINPPNSGRSIPEERFGLTAIKAIFRGEPLALETLAGNLYDHEVQILDLKVTPDDLERDLDRFAPDLVGITGVTCEANAVLAIARQVKSRSTPRVVVGGHHASADPAFFNRPEIDYVVAGLGKASFRALVQALAAEDPGRPVPGVGKTAPGGALTIPPRRYTHADLVDERAPRYDLVAHHRDAYVMGGLGMAVGFVATAFGCTHRCAFCSIPNLTGGRYLNHSSDAVLRDIRLLEGIDLIRFVDANTFGNRQLAEELAHRLIDAGIQKKIVADVRSDTILKHPELIRLWRDAGLSTVVIGFEEITDARLAQFNKRNSVQTNLAAMSILKELGIMVIGDFIISPDYGDEDFERLAAFVAATPIHLPMPSILTPIPGTPLYERMRPQICIHDLDYYTFTNAVVPTRMETRRFYETYAELLKHFHRHVTH